MVFLNEIVRNPGKIEMLELAQHLGFSLELADCRDAFFECHVLFRHLLDGDDNIQPRILRLVNGAHSTAANNFQNSLSSYNTSVANASQPTVTQYDPGQTASDMQNYILSQNKLGRNIDDSIAGFANSAPKGVDVNSPQYKAIQSYVYNNFIDPKTKQPLPGTGYQNSYPTGG